MYESPIDIIMKSTTEKMEHDVMTVIQSYYIDVDKEELLRALRYDREQYKKGFEDGKNSEKQNDPLTWDELRTMEGKPVWVEAESISVGVSPYWKDWYIIKSFSDDEFMYCNDGYEWAKETQGRMWQAYRKERE